MSLNKKQLFLVISCLLNLIGLWIALGIQISHDYQQTRNSAELNVYNLSRSFEEHAFARVKEIDRLLLDLRGEYSEGLSQYLIERRRADESGYEDIEFSAVIIDRNGYQIYNDQPNVAKKVDFSDRHFFKTLATLPSDQLLITHPEQDPFSKKQIINFARKVILKDGSFGGAIVLALPTEHFSDFFQSIDVGSNGAITLFGTDRQVRAGVCGNKSYSEITDKPVSQSHPFFSNNLQSGIYTAESDSDRRNRLSSFRKLQDYPLVVEVGLAEDDIYKTLKNRRNSILVIGVILSATLIGALIVLLAFERRQQALADQVAKRESQLQETLAELEILVTTDPLTELPNRRSFFSRANTEFSRSTRYNRPLSLLMVDVDHFKEVNDRFGHLTGDAALRHIARTMKICVRESDMIARYGGEEFVIILPETDSEGAGFIAERVRREIEASGFKSEQQGVIKLTVSIGIACMNFGSEYPDIDKLLQSADDAMYRSKQGGRNCITFSPVPSFSETASGGD